MPRLITFFNDELWLYLIFARQREKCDDERINNSGWCCVWILLLLLSQWFHLQLLVGCRFILSSSIEKEHGPTPRPWQLFGAITRRHCCWVSTQSDLCCCLLLLIHKWTEKKGENTLGGSHHLVVVVVIALAQQLYYLSIYRTDDDDVVALFMIKSTWASKTYSYSSSSSIKTHGSLTASAACRWQIYPTFSVLSSCPHPPSTITKS